MYKIWWIEDGIWDIRDFPTLQRVANTVENLNKKASIYEDGIVTGPIGRYVPNQGFTWFD